eukprot:s485_g29.t1
MAFLTRNTQFVQLKPGINTAGLHPFRCTAMPVDVRRCRDVNGVELQDDHSSERNWGTGEMVSSEGVTGGSVLYWMSRDQRAHDNWALLKAQELALARKACLQVCFCLVPKFLDATIRHFDFMLRGLDETSKELQKLNIGPALSLGVPHPAFVLHFEGRSQGESSKEVPKLIRTLKQKGPVHAVICDMSPLRVPRAWVAGVGKELKKLNVPLIQVDAHNVVPVWEASDKQETGARTLRPKIKKMLKDPTIYDYFWMSNDVQVEHQFEHQPPRTTF